MTAAWIVTAALIVATVSIKAAGPAFLARHSLPARSKPVISLVAPAVLAALIISQTFNTKSTGVQLDARSVGLAAAALAIVARLPILVVVLLAALATALTRAFL
jgi:branched-subunit amino acid transport protein